jgi:Cupin
MLLTIIGGALLYLWAHDFPEFIAVDKSINKGDISILPKAVYVCVKNYRDSNSVAISGVSVPPNHNNFDLFFNLSEEHDSGEQPRAITSHKIAQRALDLGALSVYVRALAAMGTARSPLLIIVIRYSGSDAGFVTLSQFLHKLSERDISRCCEVTPAARLRFAAASSRCQHICH